MLKIKEEQKGILALVILTIVYASIGLLARYLSTGLLLFQQIYLRIFFALCLSLVIFHKNLDFSKLKKIPSNEWFLLIFRSFTWIFLGFTFFTLAVINTKIGNVAIISSLPIVAIWGVLFFKEKMTTKKFLLLCISFVGVYLISVKDYRQILVFGKGELFALASVFTFSIGVIARKWHKSLLNNREITTIIFFFAFIMLFSASIISGEGMPLNRFTPTIIIAIIVAGISNVINILLTNYGFQKVEAILAANILTLESVFGVLLGFLFYSEILSFKEIIGGIIIIYSVIQMNKLQK